MKVLCFGSANLDHVYKVDHFTVPGETQGCLEYNIKCGGKYNITINNSTKNRKRRSQR